MQQYFKAHASTVVQQSICTTKRFPWCPNGTLPPSNSDHLCIQDCLSVVEQCKGDRKSESGKEEGGKEVGKKGEGGGGVDQDGGVSRSVDALPPLQSWPLLHKHFYITSRVSAPEHYTTRI